MNLLIILLVSVKHAKPAPSVHYPATKASIISLISGHYRGHAALSNNYLTI